MTATTHPQGQSVVEGRLYVAFELSKKSWVLAMTSGFGVEPWVQTMEPGNWRRLQLVLAKGRKWFGLAAESRVVSCYEAGRDGFWVHRALVGQGLVNRVIDSASIEVNRRARRTKTDRIDARKLVALLVRVEWGETRAFRTVRVPSPAEEAARQASRERTALVADRTRLINQLRSLLALHGTKLPARRGGAWYRAVIDWAGAPLSDEVQEMLARTTDRLRQLQQQIAAIDAQQASAVKAAPASSAAGRLMSLRGVGPTTALTLLGEGLEWRAFRNRREIGGLLGFAPMHHASGELQRDQGISRAGNHRLQSAMVQVAWSWLRLQPKSDLTRWFRARFDLGRRLRRIGIVALARKLNLPSIFGTLNPFIPFSRMKPRISSSNFAHTTNTSAIGELVIHILLPCRRYPPSTFLARVSIPAGSLP